MSINKSVLIDLIAKNAKMSKAASKEVLNIVLDIIAKSLKKGKSVSIVKFGTFSLRLRKKRAGINPSTGEKIWISEKRVPAFKAGKPLKELVA